jgi:hypothetical protein
MLRAVKTGVKGRIRAEESVAERKIGVERKTDSESESMTKWRSIQSPTW